MPAKKRSRKQAATSYVAKRSSTKNIVYVQYFSQQYRLHESVIARHSKDGSWFAATIVQLDEKFAKVHQTGTRTHYVLGLNDTTSWAKLGKPEYFTESLREGDRVYYTPSTSNFSVGQIWKLKGDRNTSIIVSKNEFCIVLKNSMGSLITLRKNDILDELETLVSAPDAIIVDEKKNIYCLDSDSEEEEQKPNLIELLKNKLNGNFRERVAAQDSAGDWYVSKVLALKDYKVKVHYMGFGADTDEWVDLTRVSPFLDHFEQIPDGEKGDLQPLPAYYDVFYAALDDPSLWRMFTSINEGKCRACGGTDGDVLFYGCNVCSECKSRLCLKQGCYKYKHPLSNYCKDHTCFGCDSGAEAYSVKEGRPLCLGCKSRVCSSKNCFNGREFGKDCCILHLCESKDCAQQKGKDVKYCSDHSCDLCFTEEGKCYRRELHLCFGCMGRLCEDVTCLNYHEENQSYCAKHLAWREETNTFAMEQKKICEVTTCSLDPIETKRYCKQHLCQICKENLTSNSCVDPCTACKRKQEAEEKNQGKLLCEECNKEFAYQSYTVCLECHKKIKKLEKKYDSEEETRMCEDCDQKPTFACYTVCLECYKKLKKEEEEDNKMDTGDDLPPPQLKKCTKCSAPNTFSSPEVTMCFDCRKKKCWLDGCEEVRIDSRYEACEKHVCKKDQCTKIIAKGCAMFCIAHSIERVSEDPLVAPVLVKKAEVKEIREGELCEECRENPYCKAYTSEISYWELCKACLIAAVQEGVQLKKIEYTIPAERTMEQAFLNSQRNNSSVDREDFVYQFSVKRVLDTMTNHAVVMEIGTNNREVLGNSQFKVASVVPRRHETLSRSKVIYKMRESGYNKPFFIRWSKRIGDEQRTNLVTLKPLSGQSELFGYSLVQSYWDLETEKADQEIKSIANEKIQWVVIDEVKYVCQ